MMHCTTSLRDTKNSAERSQMARPSRLTNGFFSLSRNRDDCPAAGRMTANDDMVILPRYPGVILGTSPRVVQGVQAPRGCERHTTDHADATHGAERGAPRIMRIPNRPPSM